MKVGDLVKIIGSHGEGPEVTSVIGIIMEPWEAEEWWVILTPNHGLVHWPESQITKVINDSI